MFINKSSYTQTNWSSFFTYHSRILNDVFVNDFNHICLVGGNKQNDSIQTIFLSNDAGNTWNYISDNLGSWLTSVYFTTSIQGMSVGYDGKVLKTVDGGNTWTKINLTGNLNQRHFSSVFFTDSQNGFIVGGNELLGMHTIIKTTDGGNTWTIILDETGSFFNAVYFPSANVGYAVGNYGALYKTSDAGNTWSSITINNNAGGRDFKSVSFISNTLGFIVGGHLNNDSIQTILKTTDGGSNWTIIRDNISPMLNDIYFTNQEIGYAVGNNGTVLYTDNSGTTWNDVVLPNNNSNYNFNAVNFFNTDYGYILGNYGIVYRFYNPLGQSPLVHTLTASDLNADTIKLNATVNPNGYTTNVVFEYGLTENYGDTIQPNLNIIQGNTTYDISVKLFPLNYNTLYHYRVKAKNIMGISYGEDKQFFVGNSIPNFDFEKWDTTSFEMPAFYSEISRTVSKTTDACHGIYAIKIENDTVSNNPGVVLMGESDNGQNFYGGVSFNAKPDSLTGCFKYNIVQDDTAFIMLMLKKNGTIISNNLYKIYGNSNNIYADLTFPIQYMSSENPDSLILGFVTSDIFHHAPINPNNFLYVDNIHFVNIMDTIPNFDFENWQNFNFVTLTNWNYNEKEVDKIGQRKLTYVPVQLTTIHHYGKYAALLKNIVEQNDTSTGYMSSGKFPVFYKPRTLNGFYQYDSGNIDTFSVSISLYKQDTVIGSGYFYSPESLSSFNPFEIPINYFFNRTPDSALVTISSGVQNSYRKSYAIIDDLNFDSYLIHIEENYLNPYKGIQVSAYPNPVNSILNIDVYSSNENIAYFYLTDIQGKILFIKSKITLFKGENRFILNVNDYAKGIYYLTIITNNSSITKKILIY